MIQENIAELVGTLKFKVDARPLVAFEKRLSKVTTMLQQFGEAANKKFNIKVSLDSRTLRAQLDKATNAKIVFKNFSVNEEALVIASKKICETLDKTPIRLANIKVDVSELVAQKRFVRTLLSQMQVNVPMTIQFKQAEKMLREWKKTTEDKFTLRIKADISQANFLSNVRKSLKAVQDKVGAMEVKIADPKLKLKVDQADLRAQLNAVISSREYTVRLKVRRGSEEEASRRNRAREDMPHRRGERSDAFGGGIAGASMGFMRGAIPGLGAAFAFSQLNQINQQMQAQQNAMTAVMGSEEKGQEQSKWVKDLSNTIGMDYRQVAPSYNKMLASGQTSGLSTESVQNIFQGVSEYGRTMGLDSESMKGSMRAIEQMMNKGQVMSEELKGQLAERMPGAISAMAEAAEFTGPDAVAKLFKAMENGEIRSNAVLEKFSKILAERARQGDALDKAMQSTAAQQARMNNAFSDTVAVFSAAGFDKGMGKFFKAMADGMKKGEAGFVAFGKAFEVLIEPVNAFINVGAEILSLLPKIGAVFGLTGGQLATLGIAAGLMLLPFGGVITAVGALALALDDLITYSEGGDSFFGRWVESTPKAKTALEELKVSASSFGETFKLLLGDASTLNDAIKGLEFSEMMISTMKELKMIIELLNGALERTSSLMKAVTAFKMGNNEEGLKNLDEFGAKRSLWNTVRGNNEAVNEVLAPPTAASVFSSEWWLGKSAPGATGSTAPSGEAQVNKLEEIRQSIEQSKQLPPISLMMPITVESGGNLDSAAAGELKERVEGVIRTVISDAMIGLKENK